LILDERAGKALYAAAFVVVLPAALVLWAALSRSQVALPVPATPALGYVLSVAGVALLTAGIASILRYGKGLPMNAFPPEEFVRQGAYALFAHPIYVGFGLLCFGAAAVERSPSGFWLVAPAAVAGSAALVLGYERLDLARRFGGLTHRPLFSLPPSNDARPRFSGRLAVWTLVFLPWLAVYESLAALPPAQGAFSLYLPLERGWPVVAWTEAIYAATYVFVALAPFAAKRSRDLRDFAASAWLATGVCALCWVVLPFVASPRPFAAEGPFGRLLVFERAHDVAANAFPSFHVAAAFLAARAFASRWPRAGAFFFGFAGAIAASCVTTGMHAVADVAAGAVLYFGVSRRQTVWEWLRRGAEKVANSWREWRLGPVRVINYAFYAGISGALAVAGVATLLGSSFLPAALAVAGVGVLFAALGAQWIEGSQKLLRPYGYFGAVAGVIGASVLFSLLFGTDVWLLVAAFCAMAPWIVAVGRLRCLVQGCCHGSLADDGIGIRYTHPMSRVSRLAGMAGVPMHPTQLYSILWNAAIGLLLVRFWLSGAPISLITGVYFVLAGLGRFVEEAYRGEPQTPITRGLRLYQWLAIASIAGGAIATTVTTRPAPSPSPSLEALAAGVLFGFVAAAAYGMDFPRSGARFARLT
jgi:protein-S-isoprenylcysteine O-methyltransferase Ste14